MAPLSQASIVIIVKFVLIVNKQQTGNITPRYLHLEGVSNEVSCKKGRATATVRWPNSRGLASVQGSAAAGKRAVLGEPAVDVTGSGDPFLEFGFRACSREDEPGDFSMDFSPDLLGRLPSSPDAPSLVVFFFVCIDEDFGQLLDGRLVGLLDRLDRWL